MMRPPAPRRCAIRPRHGWVTVTTSDGDSLAMELRDDARDARSVIHVYHAVAKRTQAGVTFGAQGLADAFVRRFRAL
jgi:hypothetical protein